MKLKFASLLLLPTFFIQAEQLWTPHLQTKDNVVASRSAQDKLSAQFQLSSIDELRQQIQEQGGIRIPLPQGDFISIQLIDDQILPQSLAEKYPHLRNYQAIDADGLPIGQFSMTREAFHGLFQHQGKFIQLEKINGQEDVYQISYPEHSQNSGMQFSEPKQLPESATAFQLRRSGLAAKRASNERRSFRIAFTATPSFTNALGGKEKTMARIAQLVSNLNAVYITDLNIRFTLSSAQENLIFDHTDRDPFTENASRDQFTKQNTKVQLPYHDQLDIGMVLSKSDHTGGGLAYVKSLCSTSTDDDVSKSSAVSQTNNPFIGTFYLIIAHELGHQLGASHTYNSCIGADAKPFSRIDRKTESYIEPGSGSTIMAYPGVCGPHNLTDKNKQVLFTPSHHFHSFSLEEMNEHLDNVVSKGCGTAQALQNTAPVIVQSTLLNNTLVIPTNAPFSLEGIATDENNDPIIYTWEQMDGSSPKQIGEINTDTGQGPLFRTYAPSSENTRTFPLLTHILNDHANNQHEKAPFSIAGQTGVISGVNGETLPTERRQLEFNLTARDGEGGVTSQKISLLVKPGRSFEVFNFNPSPSEDLQQIQWNVADTNNPDYTCQTVNISLLELAKEQLEYPYHDEVRYHLLSEYPLTTAPVANNGSHRVALPNRNISHARIKVSCAENVFFAVSKIDFPVTKKLDQPSVTSSQIAKNMKQGQRFEVSPEQLQIDNLTLTDNQSLSIEVPDASLKYTVKKEINPDSGEEKDVVQLQSNYFGDLALPVLVFLETTDPDTGATTRQTLDTYMLNLKIAPNKKQRTTDLPTTGTTPRDTGTVPTSQNSGGGDSGGASFLFLFTIPLLFRRK